MHTLGAQADGGYNMNTEGTSLEHLSQSADDEDMLNRTFAGDESFVNHHNHILKYFSTVKTPSFTFSQ